MFVSEFNQVAVKFIENFNYDKVPNITIIVGKEGLGKTLLLNMLYHKVKNSIPDTILIEAEKFSSKYIYAIHKKELALFREFFRNTKLLLLDNIDSLKNKNKTIDELFFTLDTVLMNGGKSVITYKGEKLNTDFLGHRFSSMINSGLIIELKNPTEKEINNFIDYLFADSILVNKQIPNSFFDEKNLKRIVDYFDNSTLNSNFLMDNYSTDCFNDKINLVLSVVCEYFGTTTEDILSNSKKTKNVNARYWMYLLLKDFYKYSYSDIAKYLKKDVYTMKNKTCSLKEKNQELYKTLYQRLYFQIKQQD